jgi:hypothetical protein
MAISTQVFWYNGFIVLSNGSKAKIGNMRAGFEHFFHAEWKKIDEEKDPNRVPGGPGATTATDKTGPGHSAPGQYRRTVLKQLLPLIDDLAPESGRNRQDHAAEKKDAGRFGELSRTDVRSKHVEKPGPSIVRVFDSRAVLRQSHPRRRVRISSMAYELPGREASTC